MKTAITVWGDRISPVFDSARKLLIAEIENQKITSRRYEPFDPDLPYRLAERLNELNIGVFLCGAISTIPANTIELSGIELISFISGNVDEILQEYAEGKPIIPTYLMPGCKCRHRMRKNRERMACPDQGRKKFDNGPGKFGSDSRGNREPGRRGHSKAPHK
ncbi:MAG: dinitrogenase iron-molybdenum cofactor biosynthesis domain-containing protein [Desulfobacteraceae bacterium]|nr:MAG: dinitrogenase iron-molybdenum cofactor biosynthesis domain-containing protein [Desulfobacteraceae bacterium]